MYITVTNDEGEVLERWYVGATEDPAIIQEVLDREFVLATDPEDYEFLTN